MHAFQENYLHITELKFHIIFTFHEILLFFDVFPVIKNGFFLKKKKPSLHSEGTDVQGTGRLWPWAVLCLEQITQCVG